VNHVLRSFGLAEVPPRTLYSYVGLGARYLVEQALGPDGDDRLDEGVARFLEYYRHHLLDHTRPYPGIADALSTLAARGVTLSVLSNKPEGLSRVILDGLGLRAHFAAVIGGDTLPTRKPDPAGVAHLRALTGTPPERFLLVGDSSVDVRTARAGGVAFCGVAWGLVPEDLWAAGPERVVSSAREIVDVVDGAAG
jgi:phosphoglycolate phosphatase